MNDDKLSVVDPLVSDGSDEPIPGFISSRLMAAYKLDNGHVIHVARIGTDGHRIKWSYVLEHNDVVIFEGDDFSAGTNLTYGEAAREVLGFLTLCDGDTDGHYFAGYTAEQIAWRDEHAEYLAMFGMEAEDRGDEFE